MLYNRNPFRKNNRVNKFSLFSKNEGPIATEDMMASESLSGPESRIDPNQFMQGESSGMPEDPNYGLNQPQPRKHKWWETAFDVIAPVVPGLGAMWQGYENRKDQDEKDALEQFNKDRDFRQKGDIYKTDDERQAEQQGLDAWYKNADLGLKKKNLAIKQAAARSSTTAKSDPAYNDYMSAVSEYNKLKAIGVVDDNNENLPPRLKARLQVGAAKYKDASNPFYTTP